MTDDQALLSYLSNFSRFGFSVLSGVPLELGHVKKLQNRIAFERLTHYGSGYTVEVKEKPSNIAYTHHRLGFHSDLTHYDYMPGVRLTERYHVSYLVIGRFQSIFLHCLVQHTGKGGESLLVDGFKARKTLANHSVKP